jgi:hypothetical protein
VQAKLAVTRRDYGKIFAGAAAAALPYLLDAAMKAFLGSPGSGPPSSLGRSPYGLPPNPMKRHMETIQKQRDWNMTMSGLKHASEGDNGRTDLDLENNRLQNEKAALLRARNETQMAAKAAVTAVRAKQSTRTG